MGAKRRELQMLADQIDIREATPGDAEAIAAIYNHYVRHDIATFELEAVAVEDIRARIAAVQGHALPWLVAAEGGAVRGYAYAAPWRARAAYRHSVETSIYLAPGAGGRGLGRRLYQALFVALPSHAHAAIGGVSLPNPASVALHERLGFRKVAHFSEVGRKFGRWIDVGYWQRLLSGESVP